MTPQAFLCLLSTTNILFCTHKTWDLAVEVRKDGGKKKKKEKKKNAQE